MQRIFTSAVLLLLTFYCLSQETKGGLSTPVELSVNSQPLSVVLEELRRQSGLTFTFSNEEVDVNRTVTINTRAQSLRQLLAELFSPAQFEIRQRAGKVFILKRDQLLVQTIRGIVRESATNLPIPGANVIIIGSEPLLGASTDSQGRFRIENVPVGRQALMVSFMGYLPRTLSNLQVDAGKELVLQIELEESVTELQSIVVTDQFDKSLPLNEMAMVSAKSFSVEETSRYAGSFNDPARMATSYAGVVGSQDDTENAIIVRGNSPRGLLWRLEGMGNS